MKAKLPIDNPDYFWSKAEEARTMAEQMPIQRTGE
jgi:hypothetical protein